MNKKLLKKTYRELIVGFITTVLLFSIFLTSAFPQAVKAGSFDVVKAVSEIFETEIFTQKSDVVLPEIADVKPKYEVWVLATAYSSDVWQTDSTPCIPAMSNFDLCQYYEKYGLADSIAANFLALGTQVRFVDAEIPELENYGFVVRDRMNSKYNGSRRIDIWMPTYEEAKNFGVKWLKMEVYPYR